MIDAKTITASDGKLSVARIAMLSRSVTVRSCPLALNPRNGKAFANAKNNKPQKEKAMMVSSAFGRFAANRKSQRGQKAF